MKSILLAAVVLLSSKIFSQQLFTLRLENSTLTAVPAVHSGAFGTYNSKWFFIGGRKNGLHGFHPPFAFPVAGINDSIFFVDPVLNQQWGTDVYSLPDSIREPLTSTNMEFCLSDSILYMVGGYGWHHAIQDFKTFPTLTAINISTLMYAVMNQQPVNSSFRQITDSNLAITGAHLQKLDSVYYLVFGHRFDGTYNRSDTAGFFVQQYSNEIRKFQIADDGVNLSLYNYSAVRDTDNFHRRDFNLIPFYDPFRGEGLLAFSGVFQKGIDLPFLNVVEIFNDTVIVRNDFNQNLSQYHSAVCALYDSTGFIQHNIFFGGMSMYYIDTLTHLTVTDSFVPFVRTISDVARDADLNYHEIDAGIRMPALLGTNAYFFPDETAPLVRKHFFHLNSFPNQQRIGFITGGIESPEINVGLSDASLSFASRRVFEVFVVRDTIPSSAHEIKNDVLNFFCRPNPSAEQTEILFELKETAEVKIELLDMSGRRIKEVCSKIFSSGKQKLLLNISELSKGIYNCVLTVNNQRKSVRLVKD